jgi:hypothetical protein
VPAVAVALVALVMTGTTETAGVTVRVSVAGALVPMSLVAVSVRVKTPLSAGVPLMMPVAGSSVRPAGSAPPARA